MCHGEVFCNPSTQEVEAEGFCVQGHLGLHSEVPKKKMYDFFS